MKPEQAMFPARRPVLRADATVYLSDGAVELVVDGDEYRVSTPEATALCDALLRMNGMLNVEDVCTVSGLSRPTAEAAIPRLVDLGALHYHDQNGPRLVDTGDFARICRSLYTLWKERLFGHPLWVGLAAGSLPRSVFVGWAIESYWFILGVLDRLPMAIAGAENRNIRNVFCRHFAEEWDHYLFFERALDSLGVDTVQRAAGEPLPATRAVQNWMRRAARQDPLRYAACSGFLESTGRDRDSARTFFEHVASHYGCEGREAVSPMVEHVALDEAYEHSGFVEKTISHVRELDRERARAALRSAFGLVETLEMWSTDILHHYATDDALPLGASRSYRRVRL